MNKIKVVLAVFLVTCTLSMLNVRADSYLSLINVTIPSLAGNYTTDSVTKTTISKQYIKKFSTEGTIGARLENVTTQYATTVTNTYVPLISTSGGLGEVPTSYKLSLRNSWSLFSTTFTGTWVLDDFLL